MPLFISLDSKCSIKINRLSCISLNILFAIAGLLVEAVGVPHALLLLLALRQPRISPSLARGDLAEAGGGRVQGREEHVALELLVDLQGMV